MDLMPDVFFGSPDKPLIDWREVEDDSDPDDDEWSVTPEDVVEVLGFDPKVMSAEDSDTEWTYAGGYTVTIENPAGSIRSGTDKNGRKWSIEMKNPYGYVNGVKGKDKDQLDCFIGDNPYSDDVFIIDQIDPDTGNFDEHKIVLGANSEQEATDIYYANYQPGWRGLGAISHMAGAEFNDWVKNGGPKAPYAYEKKGN